MKRWFGRLAFSFIVIAAVLAWEGHKRADATMYYVAAAIFGGLGIIALRERHRPASSTEEDSTTDERR